MLFVGSLPIHDVTSPAYSLSSSTSRNFLLVEMVLSPIRELVVITQIWMSLE